ncbi:unnamed protein product, partial [Ceratitis capitata]
MAWLGNRSQRGVIISEIPSHTVDYRALSTSIHAFRSTPPPLIQPTTPDWAHCRQSTLKVI